MLPFLIAALLHAEPPETAPGRTLELIGVQMLDSAAVRAKIGRVPVQGDVGAWADGAIGRIVQYYQKHDFPWSRAWVVVSEERIRFEVDEGVMERVVFHGLSIWDSARYRMTFDLPFRTFRGESVQSALVALQTRHDLAGISFRVDETDEVITGLGLVVPSRTLHIFPAWRESFGFNFGVHLDSTYGLLPQTSLRMRDAMLDGDRFGTNLAIGVPYRKYLFDAAPNFQWVHGQLGLEYRFPVFAKVLAASIGADAAVSDDARAEVSPTGYYVLRTGGLVDLGLLLPPGAIQLGIGVRYSLLFDRTAPEPENPNVRAEIFRYGLRIAADYQFSPEIVRRDLRSFVATTNFLALDDENRFFCESRISGQWALRSGYHDFLIRGEGVGLYGDVTVVDEVPLSSDFQHATFGGRFWIRQALTLELAARFSIWKDRIKLGLFNDFSVFGDLREGGNLFAMAEGFGPSAHVLIFGEVAFDLYYSFGFSGESFADFDHNVAFTLHSVF